MNSSISTKLWYWWIVASHCILILALDSKKKKKHQTQRRAFQWFQANKALIKLHWCIPCSWWSGQLVLHVHQARLRPEATPISPKGLVDRGRLRARPWPLPLDHLRRAVIEEAPTTAHRWSPARLRVQAPARPIQTFRGRRELRRHRRNPNQEPESARVHRQHDPQRPRLRLRPLLAQTPQGSIINWESFQ